MISSCHVHHPHYFSGVSLELERGRRAGFQTPPAKQNILGLIRKKEKACMSIRCCSLLLPPPDVSVRPLFSLITDLRYDQTLPHSDLYLIIVIPSAVVIFIITVIRINIIIVVVNGRDLDCDVIVIVALPFTNAFPLSVHPM